MLDINWTFWVAKNKQVELRTNFKVNVKCKMQMQMLDIL